ncbi:lipopolysaccharide biosynthesis protein [Leucobacter tenebrionis]|uniref:lipopolysaccharide biosynthesis protein n=1 Tax=Leucobacter tenebrionis TaxID=2873270 RepID=UPI001CA6F429|nr:oligosaccharide flippase family protein [Leucobacter tenebrionis]QZY53060.1 oligosaccharide flippase family protein [Leucobacter tenebrionis]
MTQRTRRPAPKAFRWFVGSGRSFKNVTTVFTGTAAAHAFTFLIMVPLARLYSPADFGLFVIIQSVAIVGTSLASLRYDMAIVLPDSNTTARVLHRLASRTIAITSLLLASVLFLARRWIEEVYDNRAFSYWALAAAGVVFFTAQIANTQFWLTRQKAFAVLAANKAVAAIAVGGFQLLFAFVTGGFEGLLLGLLLGQALALVLVALRAPELRAPMPRDAPTMREVAVRYRRMPLLNGPNVVLDAVREAGVNILIGNIAVSGLGQYNLAFSGTIAPVKLLNGAVSSVFLQKLATTGPGHMFRLVRATVARALLISLPGFTLFYLLAPWFFPALFGNEWAEAGRIAQALVPWTFMLTLTTPISTIFVALEAQGWALALALLQVIVVFSLLIMSPFELLGTVRLLGGVLAGFLLFWLANAFLLAHRFDRRGASSRPDADSLSDDEAHIA